MPFHASNAATSLASAKQGPAVTDRLLTVETHSWGRCLRSNLIITYHAVQESIVDGKLGTYVVWPSAYVRPLDLGLPMLLVFAK